MKPLHRFLKRFYRNPIPLIACTPALIELFDELKKGVTYLPVLVIFDPDKLTFFHNDWSAEVMRCILMQPTDDEE